MTDKGFMMIKFKLTCLKNKFDLVKLKECLTNNKSWV